MREFLQLNADLDPTQQIGIVSATTVDTPHYGSVLASTVAHFNTAPISAAVIWFVRFLGKDLGFLGKGANDMTPEGLAGFNQTYATPPPQFNLSDSSGNSFVTNPYYFSTSADADKDGNRKISAAEASPPYPQSFGNFAYQVIPRGQPVTTLLVAARLTIASTPRDTGYFLNDCLVPIYSAQYPGTAQHPAFSEIKSYRLDDGRNHGTIRKPDVATLVLQKIVFAESKQP